MQLKSMIAVNHLEKVASGPTTNCQDTGSTISSNRTKVFNDKLKPSDVSVDFRKTPEQEVCSSEQFMENNLNNLLQTPTNNQKQLNDFYTSCYHGEDSSSDEDITAKESFNVFNIQPNASKNYYNKYENVVVTPGTNNSCKECKVSCCCKKNSTSELSQIQPPSKLYLQNGDTIQQSELFICPKKEQQLFTEHRFKPSSLVIKPELGSNGQEVIHTLACPYCKYKCVETVTLRNHILTHGPNVKWTCPYCPMQKEMTKPVVQEHITICHPGARVLYVPFGAFVHHL